MPIIQDNNPEQYMTKNGNAPTGSWFMQRATMSPNDLIVTKIPQSRLHFRENAWRGLLREGPSGDMSQQQTNRRLQNDLQEKGSKGITASLFSVYL